MKKSNFLLFLLFVVIVIISVLTSCEKNEVRNYQCNLDTTSENMTNKCGIDSTNISGAFDMTYTEKWDLERKFTYEKWIIEGKDSTWATSKFHCVQAYCPVYVMEADSLLIMLDSLKAIQ